jgi:hypothetical protein
MRFSAWQRCQRLLLFFLRDPAACMEKVFLAFGPQTAM